MISFVNAICFVDLLHIFRLVLLVLPLHDEAVPQKPGDEEYQEKAEQIGEEDDEECGTRDLAQAFAFHAGGHLSLRGT